MNFALDVGTRTVVGVLYEKEDSRLRIKDFVMKEHEERAMLDGQIHDVSKVSRIVGEIKDELEERSGEQIRSAAIALAGRYLKTVVGHAEMDVSHYRRIDENLLKNLELEAVRNALEKLRETTEREMYCVGYSVLYYYLDGEWMKNLLDHRGSNAEVKVIAAFLPSSVVDAMLTVLEKNSMEVNHMTLEPMAVMEFVVPPDLRRLNIALVDVGAGTSDIAIARDGTIIAYGMVPKAGDEISDRISSEYLLDFNTAEHIKRALVTEDDFKVKNILDFEVEIKRAELMKIVDEVVEDITSDIANQILELNGKPPVAVIVVGGGAKVPGFIEKLAEKLDLPANRITLKDVRSVQTVVDETGKMMGSEFVTPVGIAYSGGRNTVGIFTRITVNGRPVHLVGFEPNPTVLQALLQMGYKMDELIGKPGPGITFELNGELKVLKGNFGREAPVRINGEPATLRSTVKNGDVIEVGKPEIGEPARVRISDVVEPVGLNINGKMEYFMPIVKVNGIEVDKDYEIKDNDSVVVENRVKVERIVERFGSSKVRVVVDGKTLDVSGEVEILRDGEPLDPDAIVEPGENLKVALRTKRIRDIVKPKQEYIELVINGKNVRMPVIEYEVFMNGETASLDSPIHDGAFIEVKEKRRNPKLLEIFNYLDLDLGEFKDYEIKVNGKRASFTDILKDGDEITLELM